MNSLSGLLAKTKMLKMKSYLPCFLQKKFFTYYINKKIDTSELEKKISSKSIVSDDVSSESSLQESESNDISSNNRTITWDNRYNKKRKYNHNEDIQLFNLHNERKRKKAESNQHLKVELNSPTVNLNISFKNKPIILEQKATTFKELDLDLKLLTNLNDMNYDLMTDIQKNVIGLIFQGKDVMACSKTGSGKTIAFLLPIVNKLLKSEVTPVPNKSISYPVCLILAPTRELAEQIYTEARKICFKTNIIVGKVYGGVPSGPQINNLNNGVDILIATPGRLMDLTKQGYIDLSHVTNLIIDEADRMLDMGFIPQIKEIISDYGMPSTNKRQNLFFSATFPTEIQALARNYMKDYYMVSLSNSDKLTVNENIKQELHELQEGQNENIQLLNLIKKLEGNILSKIVFYLRFL